VKSEIRSRRAAILAAAACLSLFTLSRGRSGAQSAPSGPKRMPEVVGLYSGMYVGDAYNLLKSYPTNVSQTVGMEQQRIHGLNGDNPLVLKVYIPGDQQESRDQIDAAITAPPNEQVIWYVHRAVSFEDGKRPSVAAVVAGLRQKYGPEMPDALSRGASGVGLDWVFDRQGRRLPDSVALCDEILWRNGGVPVNFAIDPRLRTYAFPGVPGGEACKTAIYLHVDVSSATGDSVASMMQATLFDLGLALNEGLRTQAALQAVANADQKAAAQRQKKIDKSAVPTF
jgi:hypothetical protein